MKEEDKELADFNVSGGASSNPSPFGEASFSNVMIEITDPCLAPFLCGAARKDVVFDPCYNCNECINHFYYGGRCNCIRQEVVAKVLLERNI
ncbi:MAG: hypothetical protein LBL98_07970 [Ruminococcus sp.]|jgi:hypothetical protein|nr:hypothetical protein [Ruminococcus sp.]